MVLLLIGERNVIGSAHAIFREHHGCLRCDREIVREGEPGIYHCWSRCCRRACFLGMDPLTGKDHNHRRQWVVERLQLLVANFVVDVCFLAVLSNHWHVVLRSTPRLAQRMGSWEVARRWLRVYPGRRMLDGPWIEPTEEQVQTLAADKEKIKIQLLDWCGRGYRGTNAERFPRLCRPSWSGWWWWRS